MLIFQHCSSCEIPVPKRFADAFYEAVNKAVVYWRGGEVLSLDQAFNIESPTKRKHQDSQKLKFDLQSPVYEAVLKLKAKNVKIGSTKPDEECLFEQVGAQFGIGKTTVGNYFYPMKEAIASNKKLTDDVLKARAFKSREDANYANWVREISKFPRKS